MDSPYMLDTDVIIDYLRDQPSAVTFFEGLTDQPMISSITVIELYSGVRDGSETDDPIDLSISPASFRSMKPWLKEQVVTDGATRQATA